MAIATKDWFREQGKPQFADVVCDGQTIRLKSLDVLEKAVISARVGAQHTEEGRATPAFQIEYAIAHMAASIVDEHGNRIFSDTEEDLQIVRQMRGRIGDLIDRKVNELSFVEVDKLKNLPPATA